MRPVLVRVRQLWLTVLFWLLQEHLMLRAADLLVVVEA